MKNLSTLVQNINFWIIAKSLGLIEPVEVELGADDTKKPQTSQYSPLLKVLELILTNEDVSTSVNKESLKSSSKNILKHYTDDLRWKYFQNKFLFFWRSKPPSHSAIYWWVWGCEFFRIETNMYHYKVSCWIWLSSALSHDRKNTVHPTTAKKNMNDNKVHLLTEI